MGVTMDRDSKAAAAGIGVVLTLYIAWFLSWFGTFAATCTGADPKSLGTGMIFSVPFFAAALFCLYRSNLGIVGAIAALPLIVLLLRQAAWGVELFEMVNINGRSACTLMMGDDYGETHGGLEYVYPYYYVGASVISIWAIAASHWRHVRARNTPTKADVFD